MARGHRRPRNCPGRCGRPRRSSWARSRRRLPRESGGRTGGACGPAVGGGGWLRAWSPCFFGPSAATRAAVPRPAARKARAQITAAAVLSLLRIMALNTPLTSNCTEAGTVPAVRPSERARTTVSTSGSADRRPRDFGVECEQRSRTGRRGQAGPDQPPPQPFPSPGTPALDRPHRAAHPPRRLLAGVPFEVAEHDRDAVAFRESVDLVMEHLLPSGAALLVARSAATDISPAFRSSRRRRAAADRAHDAVREATWWSQGPSESRTQRPRDFSTRTRKVAWNASCASWGSESRARQTRRTIGPCRSTSAAKASSADSPRPVAYRSSNCPSVRSRITPRLKSVSICRRTALSFLIATGLVLGPEGFRLDESNGPGAGGGCNNLEKIPKRRLLRLGEGVLESCRHQTSSVAGPGSLSLLQHGRNVPIPQAGRPPEWEPGQGVGQREQEDHQDGDRVDPRADRHGQHQSTRDVTNRSAIDRAWPRSSATRSVSSTERNAGIVSPVIGPSAGRRTGEETAEPVQEIPGDDRIHPGGASAGRLHPAAGSAPPRCPARPRRPGGPTGRRWSPRSGPATAARPRPRRAVGPRWRPGLQGASFSASAKACWSRVVSQTSSVAGPGSRFLSSRMAAHVPRLQVGRPPECHS